RDINIRRGRTSPSETFPSGSAQLTLDNRDGRFTPWNTSGAYYGIGTSVIPRRQIQITANAGAGYVPVFRGFVSGWPVDFSDAGKDSTVTISCFDLQGLIADSQINQDWADQYILSLSPYHFWKCNEPVVINATPPTLGDSGSSPVSLVSAAATNSLYAQGISLARGLSNGSVYANNDGYWKYEIPATLPSGSISGTCWRLPSISFVGTSYYLIAFTLRSNYLFLEYDLTNKRYSLYHGTNTAFTYYYCTASWDNTVPHHIAVILTSGTAPKAYIDGIEIIFTSSASGSQTITHKDNVSVNSGSTQQYAVFDYAITTTQLSTIYSLSMGYFSETTSARIQRILNQTDLNASQYSITASPVVTVGEIEVGGSVLPQLQKTVNSESGDMFVTKAGVLTFTNQNYDYIQGSSGTSTAATFTDTGSNLSYGTELSIDYSGDEIINTVTVGFSGGGTTTSTASSSVTTNGRAQSTVDTYISTVSQASDLATLLSLTQSVVKPRFSSFDISSNTSDTAWQTILGLELLSKISLTRTPSSGTAISSVLLVDSIEHQIRPLQWDTRITGSAQNAGWFVLDSSVLDGADLLL
ncbi:hypothetical protein UFOVP969_35, partial [uncultured Caudovirales phage]